MMISGHARRSSHPWQLIAPALPQLEADGLTADFKNYSVAKSDLAPCYVCTTLSSHLMRVQRLRCGCKACSDVSVVPVASRILTCQLSSLVTIEVAYSHLTPARAPRRPQLTPAMKESVRDWAGQGLKPKRMWAALLSCYGLTETTAPSLIRVQRFAHHYVTGKFGGSDVRDAVAKKIQEAAYTGGEEEATAFTFTSLTDSKCDERASQIARGAFIFWEYSSCPSNSSSTTLRRVYGDVTGKPFRVHYVMGDADAAQWNAVQEIFARDNEVVFLMCYFHVAKKIYEKTRSLPAETAKNIMADIHVFNAIVSKWSHYSSSSSSSSGHHQGEMV
ncbi:LOW QUALITY PROTEIN: hypothetical protein PHMEG_00020913 [Phytophthora megakarya]|uniref:MULE transposase domain-containing protein n=1 Tax=Phytophthora megakarya TaxID=4795 RepID=A0A225VMM5_9STRA|nr:LOW QUALITY PROTEIN: hypothetical protein PHMEG_00020913 [Phytophthora megakarya]